MGLDMYLRGRKVNHEKYNAGAEEDGYPVVSTTTTLDLGYWRKHPNLHGYIVQTFAKGVDDCKEIRLSPTDLRKIVKAVVESQLPETQGFFFGTTDGTENERDLEILKKAIDWVETNGNDWMHTREVYYIASW